MITKQPFYHGTTRNLVVGFGGLFGNLHIRNRDSDGVTQKIVKCPISFAQKEKFIVRLMQDPGLNEDTQVTLPRLSFEITGFDYDQSRQMNKIHRVKNKTTDDRIIYNYMPVPYNLTFSLNSYTNTNEDNYQIMEQIIPFFSPDMNLSIKMMADPVLIQDIPLILNSVSTDDSYEGSFEDRRYINTTYMFTMKAYYYAPILSQVDPEKHFADDDAVPLIKHVNVDVKGLVKYSAIINPFAANKDDIYGIDESWTYVPPGEE
jgi:hypothetical protein